MNYKIRRPFVIFTSLTEDPASRMTPYRPGQLVSKGLEPRLDQNIHLPICLCEYDEDLPSRLLTCLHGIPASVYESELWKCDTDDLMVLLFGSISADKQVGVRDLTVLHVNPVVTPARACAAPTLDVKLYFCPFAAEFSCHCQLFVLLL